MAMTINTNISSLNAQRNLSTSQSSLSTSMQRLSSGMRINSAKDDAAGLAIAERMSAQITGLNQAQRNANDGVSLMQTAEGALGTIGNNLQRIRELAVQSRNATNSTEDRAALQKEVAQLKDEIGRVAKDTAFNGTSLLDGSFTSKAFQVGANQNQLIEIASIVDAKTDSLGKWKSVNMPATVTGGVPTPATAEVGDPDDAGGAPTVGTNTLNLAAIDVTTDLEFTVNGNPVTIIADTAANATELAAAVITEIEGLDFDEVTVTNNNGVLSFSNASGDAFVLEGDLEVTVPAATPAEVTPPAGGTPTAAPAFAAIEDAAALTINGKEITVGAANTAAERTNDLLKAINANPELKELGITASLVDGKLSIKSANGNLTIAGNTAGTGLTETVTTNFIAGKEGEVGFDSLDVSSIEGADNAILAMDGALRAVNSARADLGALQNRFESVVSNLSVNSENLSASKSRIMDADFAQETANLSRSQVLQQAGTAMVAQANQLPQGVLSLLR